MIYKYGIGEHVYIIENGMRIKEVIIVNIANGFYQVCFTDRKGSIKLRESRLLEKQRQRTVLRKMYFDTTIDYIVTGRKCIVVEDEEH